MHLLIGGIGFDVSEYLTHAPYSEEDTVDVPQEPTLPSQVDTVSQFPLYLYLTNEW
jgi:hypothetical protein